MAKKQLLHPKQRCMDNALVHYTPYIPAWDVYYNYNNILLCSLDNSEAKARPS